MFRFTIRDVLWLTALVAVVAAWSIDRHRLAQKDNAWRTVKSYSAYKIPQGGISFQQMIVEVREKPQP